MSKTRDTRASSWFCISVVHTVRKIYASVVNKEIHKTVDISFLLFSPSVLLPKIHTTHTVLCFTPVSLLVYIGCVTYEHPRDN